MSGSEAFPALETTRFEGGTPGSSLHAMTETVTALPTSNLWLVSPFHDQRSVEEWKSTQVTKCVEVMSKCLYGGRWSRDQRQAQSVREEFGWVAKRTHVPFDVVEARNWHGKLWKNLLLPGVSLWKDGGLVIHTVDFRVLDYPVTSGRYSPA